MRRVFFLLALAALCPAQDVKFETEERKRTITLQDPLTGESFEQALVPRVDPLWVDRLLRPVAYGDPPRLREIWVSPFTGFATFPDPGLWKSVHESKDEAMKSRVRAALAKFPRRYRASDQVPALHRVALAEITYEALGALDDDSRTRLYLHGLWCARDEGNEAAERRFRRLLRPLAEKRAEQESLATESMIRAGYLAGELARLDGDAKTALARFEQAFDRIRRWKAAREVRVLARTGVAEAAWTGRPVEELVALAFGDDPVDAHVATLLLVDRAAGDALAKRLKNASEELKRDVVMRARERPAPALVAALRPLLDAEDEFTALHAAIAVGRARTWDAVRALVDALAESRPENLVAGLAEAATPEAVEHLARLAETGSAFGERPKAAAALARIGGERAARALVAHVEAAEGFALESALRHAARAGDAVVPFLRRRLEDGGGGLANLLHLAARLGDPSLRALAERQIDSTDPRVRAAAACALGRRDTLRAALAAEETADVRPLLLEALGRAGGGPEIAAAIESARADSPRLFLAAMRAAGRARAKELAPRLRELVEDADVVVAAHAAHALVLLGERDATLPLLARAPWLVVSAVARGCGETGDESLVPALVAAYEADDGAWAGSFPGPDGEYDLPRREIPLAVRRLGGKQAEAFLRKIGA
jgi:HEAT repeat protein